MERTGVRGKAPIKATQPYRSSSGAFIWVAAEIDQRRPLEGQAPQHNSHRVARRAPHQNLRVRHRIRRSVAALAAIGELRRSGWSGVERGLAAERTTLLPALFAGKISSRAQMENGIRGLARRAVT